MRSVTIRAAYLICVVMACHIAQALDPRQALRQYGHQTWQSNDGLPQNSIHSILQTADGYLWFATEDGLVRFNSIDFTIFNTENTAQFRSDSIRSLVEDGSGALWIATAEGIVRYQYQERLFTRFSEDDGLPSNAVWFIHRQPSGRLIAATAAGLAVFVEGRWKPIGATAGLSIGSERRLAEMPYGGLCMAAEATLLCVDGRSLLPTFKFQALNGSQINALASDNSGRLWVGTKDGLGLLSHSKLTPINLQTIGDAEVYCLLVAKDQTLWAGTSRGLVHQAGDKFNVLEPAARIDTLFADREGALWVGTNHGVARVTTDSSGHERVERFRAVNSLSGSNLLAAFEDREGNQWLGTESEGVTVLREQKFTTYTSDDGLSGNVVRSIAQSDDGQVWIGTDGAGLDHVTDPASTGSTSFAAITARDGLSSNVVLSIAPAPNGDLWVGTPSGLNLIQTGKSSPGKSGPGKSGAAKIGAGNIRVFTSADGLADDYIRSLYVDRDGSLWIGTRHGLSHRQGDATVNYTAMDGLGSDYIGAILRGHNGDLWICTSAGLTRMRDGKFRSFSVPSLNARDSVSAAVVTTIYEDGAGTLWLGATEGGLYRMRPGDEKLYSVGDDRSPDRHTPDPLSPDPRNALPTSVSGILEDAAGHLWLSSKAGIFRVLKSDLDKSSSGSTSDLRVRSYGTADGMQVRECSSGGHPAVWRLRNGTLWFATLRGVAVADPGQISGNLARPLPAIDEVLVDDQRSNPKRDHQGKDNPGNNGPEDDFELGPGNHRIEFRYTGLSFAAPLKVSYRYRLEGFDSKWIDAGNRRTAFYTNLPPGRYSFHVVAADQDSAWSERDASLALRIHPYFYQTLWFWLALGMLAILSIWLIYRWRLERVESTFSAVLGERSRIAREIHDTLAQGIVSISLQLELVSRLLSTSTEAARAQLDQTRSLVRQSLADARTSIWELRGQETNAADLPARIGSAMQMIELPGGTQLHLEVTGTYRAVDAKIEKELLRIAQEAVTNAVRHADANRIDVLLGYDAASVSLLVQDDGRGFADNHQNVPAKGHFGIQGMRERTAGIGGTLEIDSRAGAGTLVRVKVNL